VPRTSTGNAPCAELPAAAVAAQFTDVVPSAKALADAGTHETGVGPFTASIALAVYDAVVPSGPVASTTTCVGSASVGGAVSRTVTRKPAVVELSCASVAEHLTGVSPIAKVEPDSGEHATMTAPSTASLAAAAQPTGPPAALVASAAMSAGRNTVGPVVSRTTMTTSLEELDPCGSTTVNVTVCEPSASGTELMRPVPRVIVPSLHVYVSGSPSGSVEPLASRVAVAPAGAGGLARFRGGGGGGAGGGGVEDPACPRAERKPDFVGRERAIEDLHFVDRAVERQGAVAINADVQDLES